MERRAFLLTLAAGLAGAAVGRGTTGLVDTDPAPVAAPLAPASVSTVDVPVPGPPLPPVGVVHALPGAGSSLALTIDDGTNTEVVAAFIAFAVQTGTRLTFFPNGC